MTASPQRGPRLSRRRLGLTLLAGLAACAGAYCVGRSLAEVEQGAPAAGAAEGAGQNALPRAILLAGGDAEHPFSSSLDLGARAAADELGIAIETVWSHWELPRIVADFETAIAARPDMVLSVGHPGEGAMEEAIARALEAGIAVVILNVELPTLQAQHASEGLAYVGAINFEAGARLGRASVRRGTFTAGDTAVVFATEVGRESARGDRARGVVAALREAGLEVSEELLPRALDLHGERGGATTPDSPLRRWLLQMEQRHGQRPLWVFDSASASVAWADLVAEETLPKPAQRLVTTLDLDPPALLEHLAAGRLDILWNQQPFMQGYYGLVQAHLNHRLATAGAVIDTAASGVTQEDLPLPAAVTSTLEGARKSRER